MAQHPAIELVCDRIVRDLIGGAADTAKEVMVALGQVAEDSKAQNLPALYEEVDQAALAVMKVTPSFAPPINALHWLLGTIEADLDACVQLETARRHLKETEMRFLQTIETALTRISEIGAELIKDGDTVFMFSMSSSVWRVLRRAKGQGKNFTVLVTEARPANEGLWTVDEMHKSGIPVEVSIDACLAEFIARSDIAFAGVDAVAADGSVFNKSGTYLAALTCREYGVPFYFVTDTLKFDTATLLGLPFRSDPIHYHEVLGDKKYEAGVNVTGKLFDVTPPKLITALVTELGPIHPAACINVMWNAKLSRRISERIFAWASGKL
ncbi:MAG: translation initiation factor eIF-2B [Bellilinea sp.]